MNFAPLLRSFAALLLVSALAGCSAPGPQFTILAGSENDVLEPLVQEFCKSRSAGCTMLSSHTSGNSVAVSSSRE